MAFTLPPLPYPNNALEPSIDALTMEIHHDRHHKAYVDNLNKATRRPGRAWRASRSSSCCVKSPACRENIRQAVINNGGGHANHTHVLGDHGPKAGGEPTGPLADAINKLCGDYAGFKTKMKEAAVGRFGSGWAWLVHGDGKLQILSTANQDSPYMNDQVPILGIDVWEHAYYLKYQNKRPDYVDAWWNVVNWPAVARRYADAKAGSSAVVVQECGVGGIWLVPLTPSSFPALDTARSLAIVLHPAARGSNAAISFSRRG